MTLDLITLGVVFLLITTVLGALLIFSWSLSRDVDALAWWGTSLLLVAIAMGMVTTGGKPSALNLLIANTFMAFAYSVLYSGCRSFNGRTVKLLALIGGPVLWCLVFPLISGNSGARLAVMSAIAALYSGLSAWELWRHARQKLTSQVLLIGLLCALAVFNGFRGTLGFSLTHVFWIDAFATRWSSHMALTLVALIPAIAFVFLSLAKEQSEFENKQAALVDPLTGIPNRRAFFRDAATIISRAGNGPVSCMVFDLDGFKNLNDNFGHDIGDTVLVVFGRLLADHLPEAAFGRMGGEEFAAITPLSEEAAQALADSIRRSFASTGIIARGLPVGATVSVGCATARNATAQQLIQQADLALYRAKASGRNRVISFRAARTDQSSPIGD